LLSSYPNLDWVPATLDITDLAARFRAEQNLKTPDAIQAATAVLSNATGLVSNDPAFVRMKQLDVLIFDALLESAAQQS
jgi:predicted nucleic acid-binding protein